MNQSLNSSFDSIVENFFSRNDSFLTMNSSSFNPDSIQKDFQNIKRSNIMLVLKLVNKYLIKNRSKVLLSSECKIYFDNVFVCLENCLQHGLKTRKQLFGLRIDIWSVIECMGKYSEEAQDIIESVKNLPRNKSRPIESLVTLGDDEKTIVYFFSNIIRSQETILDEYYHPNSLLLSEDANYLVGILIGLNAFDYSAYLKDEYFDFYEPIVDLRLFWNENSYRNDVDRSRENSDCDLESITTTNVIEENEELKMQQLIDQNNYLEQVQHKLESTIKNLEQKIESLSSNQFNDQVATNIENVRLSNENSAIKNLSEQSNQVFSQRFDNQSVLSKKLENEIKLREEAETARNFLEADIHAKQDTIITLRNQLDELRMINSQIFKKLQKKDAELQEKSSQFEENEIITKKLRNELRQLNQKLIVISENSCNKDMVDNYKRLIDEQDEKIKSMQSELNNYKLQSTRNSHLLEAHNLLKKKFDDNELALEEIGKKYQDAKLEIELLREYSGRLKEASWTEDNEVDKCKQCEQKFSLSKRKHHCRSCGEIFCKNCSDNEMPLPSSRKPVRVCDSCHSFLLERYSRTSNQKL
ncbi:RUN and FYVE domain-containing protein 2 [Sarcoptes scabiei]|nr:RUN and FYVE domain-containing protein 2 [Sarcoptes scabiei]